MILSIITINKNNAEGLEKTIKSVLNQTFVDYQYIIIDGASSDNSIEIIKKYQDRISYWISEPDKGIYNAMNKGILKAIGDYCLFLNSGDFLFNSRALENVFSVTSFDFKDIISCNMIINKYNFLRLKVNSPDKVSVSFLLRNSLFHPSTFIKTALFKDEMYNENNKIVSDWEFFFSKLVLENRTYLHVNLTLSVFDASGISNRMAQLSFNERKTILLKYFPSKFIEECFSKRINYLLLFSNVSLAKISYCLLVLSYKIIVFLDRYVFKNVYKIVSFIKLNYLGLGDGKRL